VRGSGNHGALNANRKLSGGGGGGGRKHRGIYEQVTDVTRLPTTAPLHRPPPQTSDPLYTASTTLNAPRAYKNEEACLQIMKCIRLPYKAFQCRYSIDRAVDFENWQMPQTQIKLQKHGKAVSLVERGRSGKRALNCGNACYHSVQNLCHIICCREK
jgi:hypothetical protein